MKAIVLERYGSLDGLALREIDTPAIGDDGVLVRVAAAGVSAADAHFANRAAQVIGKLLGMPKTRTPGWDLAGRVETVGRNVTRFKPGDEVFGAGVGSFAEYATSIERRLAPKPRNLMFEQAASMASSGLTALQGLRDTAGVQPGQRVVVYGAGGGVGTFAVQVGKALGAKVTAVTSTRNVELMRSLGADDVIDYTKEDFTKRGRQYDVVFDIGGNRSIADCRRVLTPNGTMVMVGAGGKVLFLMSRLIEAQLRSRIARQRVRNFMAKGRNEDLVVLKDFAEAGKLTPVIDRTYPLSEAVAAIRYVGTRGARGKVVIKID